MKSYRESFSQGDGRRGLTQEELLRRMAEVGSDYGERFSHATVSRWESGLTRPAVDRLRIFGRALDLSDTETAGLILLAGLAPDFRTAAEQVNLAIGHDGDEYQGSAEQDSGFDFMTRDEVAGAEHESSLLKGVLRLAFVRCPLMGFGIVGGGYALALLGGDASWMPAAYVAFAIALVLGQGFVFPDREAGIREFFWVSLFFLLTTPLLQFAPLRMNHYNFYLLGSFAGSHTPYMLALLLNLVLACGAGLAFQVLWRWQNTGARSGRSAHVRAARAVLPPVGLVYWVVLVGSNASVWIQFAVVMPLVAAVFILLLVFRDPTINPTESERRFVQIGALVVAVVATTLGLITVLAIYLSPDYPAVLPDHNLVRSWDLNFDHLGYTRAEALEMLNLGYIWHAMCVFVYMAFVVGGNFIVATYRMGGGKAGQSDSRSAGNVAAAPPSDPTVVSAPRLSWSLPFIAPEPNRR
jgi:transcriptional regulator with XRE-family HTH domain